MERSILVRLLVHPMRITARVIITLPSLLCHHYFAPLLFGWERHFVLYISDFPVNSDRSGFTVYGRRGDSWLQDHGYCAMLAVATHGWRTSNAFAVKYYQSERYCPVLVEQQKAVVNVRRSLSTRPEPDKTFRTNSTGHCSALCRPLIWTS